MEPVVTTKATKTPLTPAEERQLELQKLTRIHAELLFEAEKAGKKVARANAHQRAVGAELTKVRQRLAELTDRK